MSKYTKTDLQDMYDEHLNRTEPQVLRDGLSYAPAHALKRWEPAVYKRGLHAWIEKEIKDGELSIDGYQYDVSDLPIDEKL